ncbi:hypothetical protein FOCG_14850 [Fusarium oxysporum f. sp. radicis-lycopersici 26381]|uniref:Uncharacterized protein n=9 Tax=Fusarium oxysporum TaxID=5507 RepID=W9HKI2_FUSOX|nr:hypothetical protein FOXG_12210 [Fusarium oxysporum f. sp. lycopersici 4287]XP_031030398.1 uncharacterized protein FOBCDRAFT_12422 [Fusarium oxysporum Fo47]EWY81480.1 hypothetical protein FOYG_15716 [Fusarium oxysporum NRRL 32931]EWZ83413.1 hypothetical protein FOWG_13319 [Fusarium oxysporum f. sp. lycopersici MN25]EXL42380.1 hypothetical protein FOCG_14850 [Fusarium oxysporum f. sp. radicis-lycopersici 26381]KAJ4161924.1 hypothetical protein NW765_010011 [Fusarium oxysporum]PCD23527.1 hyp
MATMAAPHQPRYNLEDPGFEPRTARDAREAARAARNGQSPRYRRTQSPEQLDDFRPQSEEFDMRSPTSDVALQDAMLAQAQQQQQRVVPVGQVPRNAGQRRQPPGPGPNNNAPRGPQQPMPPTYPGGMDGGPQQQQPNGPREGGRYRRQSRRASESEPRPHGESPPRNGPNTQQSRVSQSMASDQHQQRRAPSPDRLAVPGNDINRLNSPSIQKSVLLPLEQKIHEYDHLMHEAQAQMNQLDDEIRALQERRRQAEDRFIEAKSKHDEYERQHADVGKALRGELMQQPPPPAVRQPVQRMDSIDSFDHRPVSAQSSFHQKPKKGGMLRMSLFNKSN